MFSTKYFFSKKLYFKHMRSNLVDKKWYLSVYQDVAIANLDPVKHFCFYGVYENRAPNSEYNDQYYRLIKPESISFKYGVVAHYALKGYKHLEIFKHESIPVEEYLNARWSNNSNLLFYPEPGSKRISLLTDEVNKGSLFGGVGTAIIFAVLLSNKLKIPLRIITRNGLADLGLIKNLLSVNSIKSEIQIQAICTPRSKGQSISLVSNEYFISTSWWTTKSLINSISPSRICYIIQDDERIFYPFGDDRYQCEKLLKNEKITMLVNTKLLYNHLNDSFYGIGDITQRSIWFEPSFPVRRIKTNKTDNVNKYKLMFYSRPINHSRTLFTIGIEILFEAFKSGVLDPDVWDLYLVGKDIPDLEFPGNPEVHRMEGLTWNGYHELISTMDAGFALMYSPHPSYVPFDLASKGIPVLTNIYGMKNSLDHYSKNIITSELNDNSLKNGIKKLVYLANDKKTSLKHLKSDTINRDWNVSFEQPIRFISNIL